MCQRNAEFHPEYTPTIRMLSWDIYGANSAGGLPSWNLSGKWPAKTNGFYFALHRYNCGLWLVVVLRRSMTDGTKSFPGLTLTYQQYDPQGAYYKVTLIVKRLIFTKSMETESTKAKINHYLESDNKTIRYWYIMRFYDVWYNIDTVVVCESW